MHTCTFHLHLKAKLKNSDFCDVSVLTGDVRKFVVHTHITISSVIHDRFYFFFLSRVIQHGVQTSGASRKQRTGIFWWSRSQWHSARNIVECGACNESVTNPSKLEASNELSELKNSSVSWWIRLNRLFGGKGGGVMQLAGSDWLILNKTLKLWLYLRTSYVNNYLHTYLEVVVLVVD